MHTTLKFILAALLVSSPLIVSAVDEHHPEGQTAPAKTSEAATPMQNNVMTEQMQKMQAAHDKAAAAKTPAERHAAMQESMKTMKDSMAVMHNNCHGKGMGMGMGMDGNEDGMDMGMMNMMMKMMDQQTSMMNMPMSK
ncbi:hypothetical protein OR626_04215 [Pseudomonas sp. S1Bt30]|uniref:Pentapeptide MXKDX repeat protein n=1 Tax=Pseudomonas quebecensis TaxID=2995174 RepID=A0ABY6QDK1_9PSED|nr:MULTISPECIES: hypothetical protein [Pseudomonas]MCX4063434.1 hypothetical protein [Pseudomonas quebecensis]UZW17884.1 hypothetical protein OSC50_21265 [Pseudomonas quebecensis]UZW24702.1 hypothetical protein OSC48_04215 [Pseudomonas quebecensis]UZW29765.1 hypothetical protein OSC49_04215 [Pseudomonas quebecensis]VVP82994.1 hypothetical protein PS906_03327 [Pseudomonas fluorescens]